jgi:hypothetical protein
LKGYFHFPRLSKKPPKHLLKAWKCKKKGVFALFLEYVQLTKIPIEYEETSDRDPDDSGWNFFGFPDYGNWYKNTSRQI